MLIESAPKDATWSEVARIAFWNRDVNVETWRKGVLSGHPSYLPQSVKRISTWNFIRFLGKKNFIDAWPKVRESLNKNSADCARLDAAWSFAVTGTFNMPPEAANFSFPGRRREIFDTIVHHQGASIYDIAKIARVPYRRTYEHVKVLAEQGLVRKSIDNTGPRRVVKLYTMQ